MRSLAIPDRTRIWQVGISVVLIVLLLAVTMGMVWHNHDHCSAGNCTLCHMVVASPSAIVDTIGLVVVTTEYAALQNDFVSVCRANEKPPRAPPV
jgi:hypothetical protein